MNFSSAVGGQVLHPGWASLPAQCPWAGHFPTCSVCSPSCERGGCISTYLTGWHNACGFLTLCLAPTKSKSTCVINVDLGVREDTMARGWKMREVSHPLMDSSLHSSQPVCPSVTQLFSHFLLSAVIRITPDTRYMSIDVASSPPREGELCLWEGLLSFVEDGTPLCRQTVT